MEVGDLGKYTYALGFTTMFSVFTDLGLTQALIRESAKFKEKADKYLSGVISAKIVFSFVVYLLIVLTINLLGYPQITKNLVYISGLIMIFDQLAVTFWGAFRGRRNLKYEAIGIVINQLIIVISGLIILYLQMPLIYLMLPFLAASAFTVVFAYVAVRKVLDFKLRLAWRGDLLKILFIVGWPFALIAIFSKIYGYIDSVILSKLMGDTAVAIYNVAMKIPFALQFVPAALAAAIFPAFSHLFISDKIQLKRTFDRGMMFLTIISVPIGAGVAVLAKPVLLSLYTDKYLESVLPLQILMAGIIFVFLNFPLGSLLNGCDKQVTNAKLVGGTMIINIILNAFFIPAWSYVGAASAFLISHFTLFIMSLWVARKIIPYSKRYLLKIFFKSIFSAGLMVVVIYGLLIWYDWNFMVLILLGALVYALSLYIIKGYTKEDLQYFITLLRHKDKTQV